MGRHAVRAAVAVGGGRGGEDEEGEEEEVFLVGMYQHPEEPSQRDFHLPP